MIFGLYVIRDEKTEFMQPMVDSNTATAIRNFSVAMRKHDVMNSFPVEFSLYRIGEYNSETGTIKALEQPEFIIQGSDVLETD